eukprot:m.392320 g.392320  ORF g.392320 m.392320 type:complete len:611 (+) comp20084_c1_seq2:360-2192(+)
MCVQPNSHGIPNKHTQAQPATTTTATTHNNSHGTQVTPPQAPRQTTITMLTPWLTARQRAPSKRSCGTVSHRLQHQATSTATSTATATACTPSEEGLSRRRPNDTGDSSHVPHHARKRQRQHQHLDGQRRSVYRLGHASSDHPDDERVDEQSNLDADGVDAMASSQTADASDDVVPGRRYKASAIDNCVQRLLLKQLLFDRRRWLRLRSKSMLVPQSLCFLNGTGNFNTSKNTSAASGPSTCSTCVNGGNTLAVGGLDGSLTLLCPTKADPVFAVRSTTAKCTEVHFRPHTGPVHSLAVQRLHAGGQDTHAPWFLSGDATSAQLWDCVRLHTDQCKVLQEFTPKCRSSSYDVDQTGRLFLAASQASSAVEIWQRGKKRAALSFSLDELSSASFVVGEEYQLLVSQRSTVSLVDLRMSKCLLAAVTNASGPDQANATTVAVWDKASEKAMPRFEFKVDAGSAQERWFDRLRGTYQAAFQGYGQQDPLSWCRTACRARRIVSRSQGGVCKVWSATSGSGMFSLGSSGENGCILKGNPLVVCDDQMVVCGSPCGQLTAWDVHNTNSADDAVLAPVASITPGRVGCPVTCAAVNEQITAAAVAYSSDDVYIATV